MGTDLKILNTRERLLASTFICGVAALALAAPAWAQTTTTAPGAQQPTPGTASDPAVVEPNADDANDTQEQAQQAARERAGQDNASEVEAVVVTGSRIRRDPTNAPTPLIQLNREEILQSGEPNVVDFLADIPALTGSVVPEDTTGSNLNDGGLSLLNLRDLGSVRTLVLVDGRRHVGSSPGSLSVDVDTIPSMLVENVEIVTGGQSALYGADAVSGVVNFILRRNFEGIELDAALAQINQDGQLNRRLSGLIGHNFLDGRLNVYAFAEWQKSDEVRDADIDWKRRSYDLFGADADPGGSQPDNEIDVVYQENVRDANFNRGSTLVISNQPLPSPTSDPDTPIQVCAAPPATFTATTRFANQANCTAIRPELTSTFFFNSNGSSRPFNFGTWQNTTGFTRRFNVGGDGLNRTIEFGQGSRLPESEAIRFQTGLNFDITDTIQLFAEAKHVKEETFDEGQPVFFQIGIIPIPTTGNNTNPAIFASSEFNIGLDNAFLDPALRDRINTNTRPVINSAGVQTGTVLDRRALLQNFGPSRTQFNERELTRYVVGLRGDRDRLFFINNFSWEAGYTWGKMQNSNRERGVDVVNYAFASDAVVDVNNVTGRGAGSIVCRVTLMAAQGRTIRDDLRGGALSPTHPSVANCTPISLFGTDFRADAGAEHTTGPSDRPGLTPEQAAYVLAEIRVQDFNEQQNFLAFTSGELWDLWGAGPIGLALGYEFREEKTSGIGRSATTGDRLLFLNTGPDFPEAKYEANELFGEIRIPILRDLPLAQNLEISGAYRYSDYTTVGEVETYSLQSQWRPVRDLFFRATYGKATRIPNLGENFRPPTQTFANGFVDPCDANVIRAVNDPVLRANRRANCLAVLPAGYDPGTDTPNTGTVLVYPSGIPGRNQGNPFLEPEESRSITFGGSFTPRWIPRLSITADYYDIKITNVIAAITAQTAANQCVSGNAPNPNACNTIFRSPTDFRVNDFIQGSINYAGTLAQGLDFTVRYRQDIADLIGRDWGRIDYSMRGNYLIRQEDFVNIANPGDASEFDATVGLPRVRFLQTITYSPSARLSFSWDWDWQASQEIFDEDVLLQNPDNRPAEWLNTGAWSQHDFTFRWDVRDDITLRGGVVNAFDNEPPIQLGGNTTADNFDFWGRRFFVGLRYRR